jgi:hypothetical protein
MILTEPLQSVPQQPVLTHNLMHQNHLQDHDAGKLLNTPDERLSPNLFLNLNFENAAHLDSNINSLKFEWTNFNPNNMLANTGPSSLSLSPVPNNKISHVSSPSYEFLNVDQFSMDNFKNECILNLDHNLLNSVSDTSSLISSPMPNRSLDLHGFSISDDTKELLDLEKPINIHNIDV